MQIQNGLVTSVAKTYSRNNASSAAEQGRSLARPDSGRSRTDSVHLSATFQEMVRARTAVDMQPEVRAERVASLKAAVANGTYAIDMTALAAKLLG